MTIVVVVAVVVCLFFKLISFIWCVNKISFLFNKVNRVAHVVTHAHNCMVNL